MAAPHLGNLVGFRDRTRDEHPHQIFARFVVVSDANAPCVVHGRCHVPPSVPDVAQFPERPRTTGIASPRALGVVEVGFVVVVVNNVQGTVIVDH